MAITDEARHELYTYLQETIGHERAATLMGHLPPVGWADVATKRDLEDLRKDTKHDTEMAVGRLEIAMNKALRAQFIAFVTTTLGIVGLVGAAAKFL